MNTATLSFNTSVRQMTKMSQQIKPRLQIQVPSFIGNALCKTCFTLYICGFNICNQCNVLIMSVYYVHKATFLLTALY